MPEDSHNKLKSILDTLTNNVVFVFPLRSVGPLQWSESKRIDSTHRERNYNEAEQRCEIIKYFLTCGKEKFDKDKEEKYFEQLTQFQDYTFTLSTDDKITLPKGKYALLKTPEGILEAKAFSILISSNQYKTLILEEPDRGMHPQLVERMIQIINQEKNNKRVLLTTHQKGFVTPWTFPDTFIFRRFETENRIIPGNVIFNGDKDANMKKIRLITSHHVPDIFFARKVLLYEGESEDLFLRELKSQIVTCKHSDKLKKLYGGDEEVAKCLVEYTFIKMNGEGNKDLYRDVSDNLQLDFLFLLDRDAVDLQETFGTSKKEIDKQLESKGDCKAIRKDLHISIEKLKEKRIFFWLHGDIEKMVTTMCDKCPDLKEKLLKFKVISEIDKSHCKIIGKKKNKKMPKRFLNKNIHSNDITESVSAMIEHCKPEDDLAEFMKILK